jgi:hypothetical protein
MLEESLIMQKKDALSLFMQRIAVGVVIVVVVVVVIAGVELET